MIPMELEVVASPFLALDDGVGDNIVRSFFFPLLYL